PSQNDCSVLRTNSPDLRVCTIGRSGREAKRTKWFKLDSAKHMLLTQRELIQPNESRHRLPSFSLLNALPPSEAASISFQRTPVNGLGVRLEEPYVALHHTPLASVEDDAIAGLGTILSPLNGGGEVRPVFRQ